MTLRMSILAALTVGLVGCGGGNFCDRSSPCPNDTMSTPAQRDQCKQTLQANANSACYAESLAYLNCLADQRTCGSNGQTDPVLTGTKVTNNCTMQTVAAQTCCTKNPTATACN